MRTKFGRVGFLMRTVANVAEVSGGALTGLPKRAITIARAIGSSLVSFADQREAAEASTSTTASDATDLVPEATEITKKPSKLTYLSPVFRRQEHGLYLRRLLKALGDRSRHAPRNIALTGSYGSGKSSALDGLFRGLSRLRFQTVRISLATINPDQISSNRSIEGDTTDKSTDLARVRSNLIQKEIVKQILYLGSSARMSGSRYQRAERFYWLRSAGLSVLISMTIATVLYVSGASKRFEAFAESSAVGLWWAIAIGVGVAALALLLFMRALHGRLRIKGLSAGPAQVELKADESAFDRYLDEIVLYFSVSRCSVAVIEDLDRFKGIEIYEELRALNVLLNNSKQIRQKVRFIYAMRDSLFEEIATITDSARVDEGPTASAASPVAGGASVDGSAQGKSATADLSQTAIDRAAERAKFFDLVIPMVPFATLRTALDLWRSELPDTSGVTLAALRVAAAHVHDMRLIQNISNEFRVFSEELTKNRIGGYLPDQVFGLMLYKNVFLDDFEKIRIGKSNLDKVEALRLDSITTTLLAWDASEREQGDPADAESARTALAEQFGEDLLGQLDRSFRATTRPAPSSTTFTVGATTHAAEDVTAPEFWREMQAAGWTMTIEHQFPTPRSYQADLKDLQAWLSSDPSETNWDAPSPATPARVHDTEEREELTHSELQSLLRASGPLDLAVHDKLVADVTVALGSEFAYDIIASGLIGRNFSLYASRFYGKVVSAKAMNYLLHVAEEGRFAPYYALEAPGDTESILANADDKFLLTSAALNVDLFDALAADPRLEKTLSSFDGIQHAEAFLNLYLERGAGVDAIIARLAPRWAGIYRFLARGVSTPQTALHALDVALRHISAGVTYEPTPLLAETVRSLEADLPILHEGSKQVDAAALTALLKSNEVSFIDLSRLGDDLRTAAGQAGVFNVTAANLKTALGPPRNWSLDRIPEGSAGALERVVEDLTDYLSALPRVTPTLTIQQSLHLFVAKVFEAHGAEGVRRVIVRAKAGLRAGGIELYPTGAWETLMEAKRVSGKPANLLRYAREFGVDKAAGELVATSTANRKALDEPEKRELALKIIGTEAPLAMTKRVRYVVGLGLATPFTLAELDGVDSQVLAYLLAEGLLEDTLVTFNGLVDRSWSTREAVIRKSTSFATYVDSITFTDGDLANIFASQKLSDKAKMSVLHSPTMPTSVTAATATAIGQHLIKQRLTAPQSAFDLIVASRCDPQVILRCLNLYNFMPPRLNELLAVMPHPWNQLSGKAKRRPWLDATPDMIEILERLKTDRTVSSYSPPFDGQTRAEVRKTR